MVHTSTISTAFMATTTIIFGVSTLYWLRLASKVDQFNRLFHRLSCVTSATAFLAYFAMSVGQGVWDRGENQFPVFWARYIDWLITTPLLLIHICILSQAYWEDVFTVVVADIFMVACGFFGALSTGPEKWGWFIFGGLFFLPIIKTLFSHLQEKKSFAARHADTDVEGVLASLSLLTLVTWTGYPVVWAVAEGANLISVDAEVACYCILDMLAKLVFSAILLTNGNAIDTVLSAPEEPPQRQDPWITKDLLNNPSYDKSVIVRSFKKAVTQADHQELTAQVAALARDPETPVPFNPQNAATRGPLPRAQSKSQPQPPPSMNQPTVMSSIAAAANAVPLSVRETPIIMSRKNSEQSLESHSIDVDSSLQLSDDGHEQLAGMEELKKNISVSKYHAKSRRILDKAHA